MTLSSERQVAQNPFIRYAEEAGWTYLSPEQALRLRGVDAVYEAVFAQAGNKREADRRGEQLRLTEEVVVFRDVL